MFAKTIIDSDAFLDMAMSAQALYFHLSMRADDEGFVNNPKKIQRMVGAAEDDLKVLRAKRFIIAFESGIVVIKHWKIHNYLQKDRCKPTVYQAERNLLTIKENKSYTEKSEEITGTICIQDVSEMDSQYSIGKDSIEEDSIEEDKEEKKEKPKAKKTAEPKTAYAEYVTMTDKEHEKLLADFGEDATGKMIAVLDNYKGSSGKSYKSDYRAILVWVVDEVKKKHPALFKRLPSISLEANPF